LNENFNNKQKIRQKQKENGNFKKIEKIFSIQE